MKRYAVRGTESYPCMGIRRSNSMTKRARIAHLAGPNATIQKTPALVTSNKGKAS